VNRIPIMAKQTLDLYELFRLVVSKGGLVEVINKKLWREITKGLNLPSSITSAAFTLRTQSVHVTQLVSSSSRHSQLNNSHIMHINYVSRVTHNNIAHNISEVRQLS